MSTLIDADFLRAFAETRGFLLGRPTRVRATRDGRYVFFLRSEARATTHDLFEYDVEADATRLLVRARDVLDETGVVLSDTEKARRERQRITDTGFVDYHPSPDGARILLPLGGRLWLWERATGSVRPLLDADFVDVVDARLSPDGTRAGFVFRHNLWVVGLDAGAQPVAVTTDGVPGRYYGQAEFIAQEEMGRHAGWWFSPDGCHVAFTLVDETAVERFTIADPTRPHDPPAQFHYPRPGHANADVRLAVTAVPPLGSAGAPVWIEWDRERHPYLARVDWTYPAPGPALAVQTRDQRETAVLMADQTSGKTRCLYVDQDPDWVNLDPGLPRFLSDGSGILDVSESSGQRVLHLRSQEGVWVRDVVPGDAGFRSLVGIDMATHTALVLLGDALTSRLVRVSLTGAYAPQVLLDDGGDHLVSSTAGGRVLIDERVARDDLPQIRVLRPDGTMATVLPAVAETPTLRPRLEYHQVGDRGFSSVVIKPRSFVAEAKYPVVVHVYGGPHALMVRNDGRHHLLDQWIADQGVIVVAVDNRGTPRRGRDWERAIKGSFAHVPLDDQVEALHALAAIHPAMDLDRVGIFGWSFGGYMAALAVLRRPDVFKAAVAGAPVVDWHDYDTHYTERYLDLPARNHDGYRESSLLTHASGLSRPLLLIHGTADDNVYFFHSLKLADALLRAGRPFDFLPLPRATHQLGDAPLRERVWAATVDYLLRHL